MFTSIAIDSYNTLEIQQVNSCLQDFYNLHALPTSLSENALVASASTKVITDLLQKEVAINDRLIFLLRSLLGDMLLSPEEAQIFLDAPCSIKRCDFRVKVGLEK